MFVAELSQVTQADVLPLERSDSAISKPSRPTSTLAFWTVKSLEVVNTLTFGGVTAAQYPMEIYSKWLREFFTFVVPLSCVTYFPIVGILGINDPLGAPAWFLYVSPLSGFLFLSVSLVIWRVAERHYTSTGS